MEDISIFNMFRYIKHARTYFDKPRQGKSQSLQPPRQSQRPSPGVKSTAPLQVTSSSQKPKDPKTSQTGRRTSESRATPKDGQPKLPQADSRRSLTLQPQEGQRTSQMPMPPASLRMSQTHAPPGGPRRSFPQPGSLISELNMQEVDPQRSLPSLPQDGLRKSPMELPTTSPLKPQTSEKSQTSQLTVRSRISQTPLTSDNSRKTQTQFPSKSPNSQTQPLPMGPQKTKKSSCSRQQKSPPPSPNGTRSNGSRSSNKTQTGLPELDKQNEHARKLADSITELKGSKFSLVFSGQNSPARSNPERRLEQLNPNDGLKTFSNISTYAIEGDNVSNHSLSGNNRSVSDSIIELKTSRIPMFSGQGRASVLNPEFRLRNLREEDISETPSDPHSYDSSDAIVVTGDTQGVSASEPPLIPPTDATTNVTIDHVAIDGTQGIPTTEPPPIGPVDTTTGTTDDAKSASDAK